MKRTLFILTGLALALPSLALADGSQSYTSPGTYTFTVPAYGTLTVTVDGAGGGGGGGITSSIYNPCINYKACQTLTDAEMEGFAPNGSGGGNSSFGGNVIGDGGGGGIGGDNFNGESTGSAGAASGGSIDTTGEGASGGAGGYGYAPEGGATGSSGGNGGQAVTTYAPGALTQGSNVSVIVGGGGAGGEADYSPYSGNGSPGSVSITWTTPSIPTCSVTLSPNPSSYASSGTPVTLSWSSSNADEVYIDNIGWVDTSGNTEVASQSSTDYSCYGYSSSYGDGPWDTTNTTLSVNPPSSPTATIAASSTSITTVESTNLTATFTAGSGDNVTADNIDEPLGTGLGANTNLGSQSITFSTSTPGTYTFFAMAQTSYYPSWTAYASTTVTQAPSCTPATQYICTGAGDDTVTASSTSAYCVNTQTPVTTCLSPQFCQAGSASCLAPSISFNQSGSLTGHLQIFPDIVQSGQTTQVYWNVSDAEGCSVQGTNGDSWSALASPAGGETTSPIKGQTTYTLSCEAYDGNPNVSETQAVDVTPVYQEE